MVTDDMVIGQPESSQEVSTEDQSIQDNTDASVKMTTSANDSEEEELTEVLSVESDQPDDLATAEEAPDDVSDEEVLLAAVSDDPSDMEALDEFMLKPLERGQIVEGTIVRVTPTEIFVDVGAKSEGIVSEREIETLDPEVLASLEVGGDVFVYVLSPEDRSGNILLSLTRALEERDWREAERCLKAREVYHSEVAGFNKGGLIVNFGMLRGFVPASQISAERRRRSNGPTPEARWGDMVGESIAVKVIEVERGRNRLILSERASEREMRAVRRQELLESLEVGQVRHGWVISLADFGAFVDLGGADGLIHLSELSWKHVTHPREALKIGDEVEVKIISIDRERQRIGLSLKILQPDPWEELAASYQVGQLVQGTITKLTKFGAFARLVESPELEGLIHISELAENRVGHPREVVQEGDVVTLRIVRVDAERRRVGLSLRRVDSEEYLEIDWQSAVTEANDEPSPQVVEETEEASEDDEG